MVCMGWTWEQVDQLTLPRLNALTAYWQRHPPTHILLAAHVGYKPPAKAQSVNQSTGNGLAELMSLGRPE
jgi:hypothetical protein